MSSPQSRVLVTIWTRAGKLDEVEEFNPGKTCGAIKTALKAFGNGVLRSEPDGPNLTDDDLVPAGRYTYKLVDGQAVTAAVAAGAIAEAGPAGVAVEAAAQAQARAQAAPTVAAGAIAEAGPAGVAVEGAGEVLWPAANRRKATPSQLLLPDLGTSRLPEGGMTLEVVESNVMYYMGRPCAVTRDIAPSVMVIAPEFGIVHDAAYMSAAGASPIPASFYEAAIELIDLSAQVYNAETERHNKFNCWFNKNFSGLMMSGYKGAGGSSSSITLQQKNRKEDGFCTAAGPASSSSIYTTVIMEIKNELASSGDPLPQALCYLQDAYRGNNWHDDAILRATGAPALLLDVAGPHLIVHGAYLLRDSVVVSEPLTPRLPLFDLGTRQPQHTALLARILAGLWVAGRGLQQRYAAAAGKPAAGGQKLLRELSPALQAITRPGVDSNRAMRSVWLSQEQLEEEAACRDAATKRVLEQRGPVAEIIPRPAPLPYPLMASAKYSDIKGLLDIQNKQLFTAQHKADGKPMFIKFSDGPYPEEIHRAWQEYGLVPELIECLRLPGGGCMVVTEFLTEPWKVLTELEDEDRSEALQDVKSAARTAHKVQVPLGGLGGSSSSGTAVHGDMRGPNIAVMQNPAGASTGGSGGGTDGSTSNSGKWLVRFLDLDWAGIAGRDCYPASMSRDIAWHPDAKPGQYLHPEHDIHLLQRCRSQSYGMGRRKVCSSH